MSGYLKGNFLRLVAFLLLLAAIALVNRSCEAADQARRNDSASAILAQEDFLLKMLDAMERGEERDWLAEAAQRGLREFCDIQWNAEYGGAYLIVRQGLPMVTGYLATQECVEQVYDRSSEKMEVIGRGREMFLYRLTYYWD